VVSGVAALLLVACDLIATPATPTVPVASPTLPVPADATNISTALTEVAGLPTPTAVPSPVGIDAAASVQIYSAVVAALLAKQSPPYVYISPYIGQGDHLDQPDQNNPLPQGLLSALPSAGGRPKYQMMDFSQAIGPLEDGGQVKNGGVFVTLGPITNDGQPKDTVAVRAAIYHKVGDAQGYLFHLRQDSSGWKVLDSKQEWADHGRFWILDFGFWIGTIV
jgi:hypothetical protein